MLDMKRLRTDIDSVAEKLQVKNFNFDKDKFHQLEDARKSSQITLESLQNDRNQRSKLIGQAKAKGEDIEPLKQAVGQISEQLAHEHTVLEKVQAELNEMLSHVPNIPHESVPPGHDEEDNRVERHWGQVPSFEFTPKDHIELGEQLGGIDFETASKIAGSRFVIMKGKIARLHRALAQFMLDTHTLEHGYTEVNVPYLVNKESLYGTGQLPKFSEDLFMVAGEKELGLISTAEIPVTNMASQTITDAKDLPVQYVCHSACFRSEAGSYGKDTRGMIRQHQFEKVELVQLVKPEDSYQALEQLTAHAESILQKLNLPYRVVTLCGGDLGFSAAKTFDLEVWLPGQNKYREISSCSNFEDFQARRMLARMRRQAGEKPELLHTVNGSGLAVGRTLIAVLENYQDAEGKIHIPEALQPYCNGMTVLD